MGSPCFVRGRSRAHTLAKKDKGANVTAYGAASGQSRPGEAGPWEGAQRWIPLTQ